MIDVRRDLRPSPLPGPGDRLSAAGPVERGRFGQRQIEAVAVGWCGEREARHGRRLRLHGRGVPRELCVAPTCALLLDVRQRRGVRGPEYAWANAKRLQAALAEAGIEYRHHPELAPTTELRQLQYAEDDRQGVGKRSRTELAPAYRERYVAEILDRADLGAVAAVLPEEGAAALCAWSATPRPATARWWPTGSRRATA